MGSFKKRKNILIFILMAGILVSKVNSQVDYVDGDQGRDRNFDFNFNDEVTDHQQNQEESTLENEENQIDHVEQGNQSHGEGAHDGTQNGHQEGHQSHYLSPSQPAFWVNVLLATLCTIVGAFCSGVAVGLMSIQRMQLQIMSLGGDQEEKKVAKRILSVVSDHHLFLVTLLVANAVGLETLPIIIHSLMPAWAAILFSTFVVLIAAEIIPQAFCTGPKKITIAYYASPIILVMIKVLWIIVYPMAKGLDKLMGEHKHQRIQHKDFANFLTGGSQNLKGTEKLLLTSILELRSERVPKIMVEIKDLYMLELRQRLTQSKIKQINEKDFSYILVYKGEDKSNVVGVIKTKEFALKYLKSQSMGQKYQTVQDIFQEKYDLLSVYEDTNLLEMLMLFQAKSNRFAIVIGKKKKIEPGIASIMYSKSDMVAKNNEGQIKGIIFLYSIFEQIAEYNQQMTNAIARGESLDMNRTQRSYQMAEIKRPLIEQ